MNFKSSLLHQMSACWIIMDKTRLNPTSVLFFLFCFGFCFVFLYFHISSLLPDFFKIMKSPYNSEICREKTTNPNEELVPFSVVFRKELE